ncbi:MAG: translation initiation factor IF-6 [Candidatus Micrarchaeota archaeon]|nr:translation initiation factor IF-6 [Candidatus Micrarchaeota archaeon]
MMITKAANFGNPHVGLFAKANDSTAFVDISASPKLLSALPALGVKIKQTAFGGSGLIGIYLAMNNNGAVVPSFCSKEEISILKASGLSVATLPGQFCAAGNNVSANDFGAVANPEMPRRLLRELSDCLGVEVVPKSIAGFSTVGSCLIATNKGFAVHNRASEKEIAELSKIFKVGGLNCTLDMGVAFVSLGAAANSKGAVIGEATSGFEAGRLSEALGLF